MGMNDKHNYDPTKWVDNSEPDIDAEHLNKIESALQEYGVSIDELAAAGGTAAKVKATDTYGLVVSALGESTAQALIDAIANKVMNELINKNKIVNNLLATDASTVLAGTQGTALDKRLVAAENAVTKLNSDLTRPIIETNASSDLKLSYNYGSNVIINNQIAFASLQPRTAKSITSNMTLPFSLPHHSAVFFIGQYNDSSSISVYGTGFANSNGTIRFDAIVGEELYRIFCIFFTW